MLSSYKEDAQALIQYLKKDSYGELPFKRDPLQVVKYEMLEEIITEVRSIKFVDIITKTPEEIKISPTLASGILEGYVANNSRKLESYRSFCAGRPLSWEYYCKHRVWENYVLLSLKDEFEEIFMLREYYILLTLYRTMIALAFENWDGQKVWECYKIYADDVDGYKRLYFNFFNHFKEHPRLKLDTDPLSGNNLCLFLEATDSCAGGANNINRTEFFSFLSQTSLYKEQCSFYVNCLGYTYDLEDELLEGMRNGIIKFLSDFTISNGHVFNDGFALHTVDTALDSAPIKPVEFLSADQRLLFGYDEASAFKNGYAIVRIGSHIKNRWGEPYYEGGRYNVIDTTGRRIFDEEYDSIRDLGNGHFICSKDGSLCNDNEYVGGKYGIANSKGKFILPVEYSGIEYFDDNNLFLSIEKDSKVGLIDATSFSSVLPAEFSELKDAYSNDELYILANKGDLKDLCILFEETGKWAQEMWFIYTKDGDKLCDEPFVSVEDAEKYLNQNPSRSTQVPYNDYD